MDLCAILRSPLSKLVLRPGYDRLAVPLLARVYFPLSRLWAIGLDARCAPDPVIAAVPGLARRRRRLAAALDRLARRAAAYEVADRCWRDVFFGTAEADADALAAVEDRRVTTAQALMAARATFLPLRRAACLAPFGWDVPEAAEVERRHGARLARPETAFVPPPCPGVAVSRTVAQDGYRTFWLRMASAVAGRPDTLWARVEQPPGPGPWPAVIFTHGICMETDFWRDNGSLAAGLARSGIMVVRPEGPFHGRRRLSGTFGGEPVLARSPLGLMDYFEAHVGELAWLTAWARAAAGGPVAVGGVSLGALTAQMAVSAAHHWPAEARPDAAFLVTTSASLMAVTMEGSLTRALGIPALLRGAGWDRDILARWMPLLEPATVPAVPPERIVAVLGSEDEITPYASGTDLMRTWRVPAENVFVRRLGHFSAALGLYHDGTPFQRLREVLGG